MKALARSYIWWPGADQNIENLAKSCNGRQHSPKMPKAAPLYPREWPSTPWQRLHIDFAGLFLDSMFVDVVDAHQNGQQLFQCHRPQQQNDRNIKKFFSFWSS